MGGGEERFQNVVEVDLYGCPIDDACFARIMQLPHLKRFSSGQSSRQFFGIAKDDGPVSMDYLNLNSTQITDTSISIIKQMPQLKTLWLNDTKITDAGIQQLANSHNLEILWLLNTRVSDKAVDDFRQSLPEARIWY